MYRQSDGFLWLELDPDKARSLFQYGTFELYEVRRNSESLIEDEDDLAEAIINSDSIVGIECGSEKDIAKLGEIKQCKKQTTVAVIMKDGELISIGTNEITTDIYRCPREGLASGVGYNRCKDICGQKNHAEVDACFKAGVDKANGATLYLIGHTYCCENCKKVMKDYGIVDVKIM